MNVVRTCLSPQGLGALCVMAAKLQGEFRWVGWCFSWLGWAGWFKGELVGEWVSAKPNGLLIDIKRSRAPLWNDHSHFILKTLLGIPGVEHPNHACFTTTLIPSDVALHYSTWLRKWTSQIFVHHMTLWLCPCPQKPNNKLKSCEGLVINKGGLCCTGGSADGDRVWLVVWHMPKGVAERERRKIRWMSLGDGRPQEQRSGNEWGLR